MVTSLPVKAYLRRFLREQFSFRGKEDVILQDDGEGKGFSVFVGTLRGLSGLFGDKYRDASRNPYKNTAELVEHPALGGGDSLQMLFGASDLKKGLTGTEGSALCLPFI